MGIEPSSRCDDGWQTTDVLLCKWPSVDVDDCPEDLPSVCLSVCAHAVGRWGGWVLGLRSGTRVMYCTRDGRMDVATLQR